MQRSRWLTGAALSLALLGVLLLPVRVEGQEQQDMAVELTPSRDSGVSGTATLKDVESGVEVTLEMQGLPEPGIKHINHIHAGGSCADDRAGNTAPVTIPLKTVVAQDDGTGSATTTVDDVTTTQLFSEDKERFILFHAEAEKGGGVPPGIACADLAPLPDTGGMSPMMVLLVGIAVLGLGSTAGLIVLLRRGA